MRWDSPQSERLWAASMRYITRILFLMLALLPLAGCSAADSLGLKIDLSQLNWQTGALIALAYLANSKGHFAAIAQTALKLLRGARVLPTPDDSQAMKAEQIAKLLAELFTQLQGHPQLQEQVLQMMATAASVNSPATSSKAGGSLNG